MGFLLDKMTSLLWALLFGSYRDVPGPVNTSAKTIPLLHSTPSKLKARLNLVTFVRKISVKRLAGGECKASTPLLSPGSTEVLQ